MRILQAAIAALPREGGAFMLQLKSVTGEILGVELSAETAAELREALGGDADSSFDHDGAGRAGGSLPRQLPADDDSPSTKQKSRRARRAG